MAVPDLEIFRRICIILAFEYFGCFPLQKVHIWNLQVTFLVASLFGDRTTIFFWTHSVCVVLHVHNQTI